VLCTDCEHEDSADCASITQLQLTTPTTLSVGDTVQATVTALDADAQVVVGCTIDWSSTDHDVVEVDSSGSITATGVGDAVIAATAPRTSGRAYDITDAAGAEEDEDDTENGRRGKSICGA
jgi:cytoskeletal protein RodZ